MKEAAGYEALGDVKWYGNDVLANEQKIVEDEVIADFALKTGLINPVFGSEEETPTFEYVEEEIAEMIGRKPDAYAVAAYDAFWLVTNAYMDNPNDASIKKVLIITAEYYYGVPAGQHWMRLETGNTAIMTCGRSMKTGSGRSPHDTRLTPGSEGGYWLDKR